jgi:hypothetical protein
VRRWSYGRCRAFRPPPSFAQAPGTADATCLPPRQEPRPALVAISHRRLYALVELELLAVVAGPAIMPLSWGFIAR